MDILSPPPQHLLLASEGPMKVVQGFPIPLSIAVVAVIRTFLNLFPGREIVNEPLLEEPTEAAYAAGSQP